VLAERAGTPPREAFETLRRIARSRGRKVHELSREVVASVTDPSVALPDGLPARRR
jgi:AmiR/NasT family two-component response regulator